MGTRRLRGPSSSLSALKMPINIGRCRADLSCLRPLSTVRPTPSSPRASSRTSTPSTRATGASEAGVCRGLRSRTAGPPRRTARGWPAAASPRPGRWCSRAAARAGLTACPGAAAAHICATTVHSWAGLLSLPLSPSCRARGVTHAFGGYARHTLSRADHVLITFWFWGAFFWGNRWLVAGGFSRLSARGSGS